MQRLIGVLLGVLIAVGGILGIQSFFSGRDAAGVKGTAAGGPGRLQPDLGDRHLSGGDRSARRCSPTVPTSGPHAVDLPTGDSQLLDDDQILSALERGDVVILSVGRTPSPALRRLQADVAGGPSTPRLIRDGGAVILGSRCLVPGQAVGLAWRRALAVRDPADPALEKFADYWLGTTPSR